MAKSYRFKCRNTKCGGEFHRALTPSEFEHHQYHTACGWACFNCGFPKMIVMKSNKSVQDTFKPGFQRNIREVCNTYGEYKKKLREKGLIEIGYEDLPDKEDNSHYKWDDSVIMSLVQEGLLHSTDGELIKALQDGSFLCD